MSAESSAEDRIQTIFDERLVRVVDAWETLDEAVRCRIVDLIEEAEQADDD